ncbi:hypothetical protein [Georgenia muralis]|uniref:Phosphodiesterase n=1 Tax=Georgenia muralis TaxID=154117 RepID=A0A3N4Z484_9MICO|nr:hypothetical protein [Georgenia muralis]RPF26674.1 hypothetical protein EDD32_1122 [Georgenia muralis]
MTGTALGAALAGVAALRGGRPLHPRGVVVPARLRLDGAGPALGGLGRAGTLDAVVRLSRAGGVPAPLPDIHGLAVRWSGTAGPNDLLLASTGTGPASRFLLVPRRSASGGALSSIMPFAGPAGPVLVAALPRDPRRGPQTGDTAAPTPPSWRLVWAPPRGAWRTFGTLDLAASPNGGGDDDELRFDPVEHCPDGLATYGWAAQLRIRPYQWSRRLGRRRGRSGQAAPTEALSDR